MNKKQILQKLRNDEDYYGDFGNQFLSNSHIGKLLKDPLNAFEPSKQSPAFAIGGYFHTCILEPGKLEKFKIVNNILITSGCHWAVFCGSRATCKQDFVYKYHL